MPTDVCLLPLFQPQAWLRRKPHPWMTPLADRLAYQDEYQLPSHVSCLFG